MIALSRLPAILALAMVFVVSATLPGLAHAVLLSSTPAESAMVQDAPENFVLTFNELVSLLVATLIEPDGSSRDVAEQGLGGADITIPLPADLGQGTHVLSWRVVSADGHPVGGATAFSIGIVTGAAAGASEADTFVAVLLWAGKGLVYGALLFGLGIAVFTGLVVSQSVRGLRSARVLLITGLLAAPLTLGLQGADALALDLGGMLSGAAWSAGLATSYGATVIVLVIAFGLALASLDRRAGVTRSVLAALAGLAGALALALSGHASAADPQWLTRPAVFLHVAGIVLWAGALVPLLLALRHDDAGAGPMLARFSKLIVLPVAAILVSGVTLAIIQLGPEIGAWASPYGYILAGKLTLLGGVFGLALYNRLALTGPAVAGDPRARGHLRTSIGIEIVLMVLVLALVAGWRFTPPPRALAQTAALPISMHIHGEAAMADITVTPGRAGPNAIEIYLQDADFAAIAPQEVAVAISAPDRGIEAARHVATLDADGYWRAHDVTLPLSGQWRLDLEIRLSRFEMVRLDQTFTLP